MGHWAVSILSVLIVVQIVLGLAYVRQTMILRFQGRLLVRITGFIQADVAHGQNWSKRMDALTLVSMDKMLFQFWKPLTVDAFWSDRSFVEPYKCNCKDAFLDHLFSAVKEDSKPVFH